MSSPDSTRATLPDPPESFPRQSARTRRFRLGAPRTFAPSPDGLRVAFLRSGSGTDPVNALHVLDVTSGVERVVVDPGTLLAGADDVPAAERARRERLRETGEGITAYSTDASVSVAAFALSGRLFLASLLPGGDAPRELVVAGPVVDPRLSPDGRLVSFSAAGAVHVVATDGGGHRALLRPESATVSYGVADFVAAEELDRSRGLWWSPDSTTLLVERYDESPVAVWWVADPSRPWQEPRPHRYPAAGTANAQVSLHLVRVDATSPAREVAWDHVAFPYLVAVSWSPRHDPLVTILTRDQRRMMTLTVDPVDGTTVAVHEVTDDHWVDVLPGTPTWAPDGRIVHTVADATTQTRRLALAGEMLTPPGLQVRAVLDVGPDGVIVSASEEPTQQGMVRVGWDGGRTPLTPANGWYSGVATSDLVVCSGSDLSARRPTTTLRRDGDVVHSFVSHAQTPVVDPHVTLLLAGPRNLRTAVLFPRDHVPGSRRLPVLMAPYGGPHVQLVVAAAPAFVDDQWFADQGFAVVVADGRGTPGRGPAWERAVAGDLGSAALADQVDALAAVAERYPDDVDASRVGIHGWSFGGYLAALAVLRRPDVFHAAVAGAPVTDWRLYDTAYTERYLGQPEEHPQAYDRSSLISDAPGLTRPLMIIHGLADDNVAVAHSLALSGALLAAGRPHTLLPLTGVTHMTPQEQVAENLLLLQVAFLREHLGT